MIDIVSATWAIRGVRAFTTRVTGGTSRSPYASLNLATHVGDAAEDVRANRDALRRAHGLPSEPFWLTQVHGARVVEAHIPSETPVEADGCFTQTPGVVCAVLTADCLPIVLADRRARCVAVLHGGWRGLARGIIEAGVAALPVPASALTAWLGPAIGPADYEVGGEVREAFGAYAQSAFLASGNGRYRADLYALARLRLKAAGVKVVHGGGLSTFSDRSLYSFRRTPACGRMATVAWIG